MFAPTHITNDIMQDYFICYINTKGNTIWCKARSSSKEDIKKMYEKMTYVKKVEQVLTTNQLLTNMSLKQISL